MQILPRLEAGGVERGTIEITRGLVAAGYKAIVVSEGGRLAYQVESAKGMHITLPVASKNPFTMLFNVFRIRKLINKYNVDIVHARSRAPAWSAYRAALKTRAKFVTTFHGTYSIGNWFKRKYNSVMVLGERVIAISDFIKEHILENYECEPDRIRVIHRGVDIEQFHPEKVNHRRIMQMLDKLNVPEDKQIVLLPGRFARWKGHEVLLRALVPLNKDDYYCLLVGDYQRNPSYRRELEKLIKELDLVGSVRIVGHMVDMPAVYAISNIVVSASTSQPEAFGRIAVEGQAMGKMVVATDHGGACETILPNKSGWLVEPGNVEALSAGINKALNLSDQMRKRVANKAIGHIRKEFSVVQMIEKTLAVYQELL